MSGRQFEPIRRFVLCTFFICFATFGNGSDWTMPEYSYLKHPLIKDKAFAGHKPVIVKRYVYYYGDAYMSVEGAVFTPQKASYLKHNTTETFGENLDSLCLPDTAISDKGADHFLEVDLNGAARVFVVVVPRSSGLDLGTVTSVKGFDASWTNLQAISSSTGRELQMGGNSRPCDCKLPVNAVTLEREVAAGEKLVLPHPRVMKINGQQQAIGIHLLFARPGKKGSVLVPFQYPKISMQIKQLVARISKLRGMRPPSKLTPVQPNEMGPSWLHDLYVTPSRTDRKFGEPIYWQTWHPIVDPIYWCYFDHEHGSNPGNYDPQFDYTAFKTKDPSTRHGRQEESDQGFKVFSLPLPKEKRFFIMTIHMQCSKARRITTRFHTGCFAVLNQYWDLEMELCMKVDFGGSVATLRSGGQVPFNSEQDYILEQLHKNRTGGRKRRINVLDMRSYPSSVDKNFAVRQNRPVTMANKDIIKFGVYEKWSGGPYTCTSERGVSFTIDVRNAATAKRKISDGRYAELQMLAGDSTNRKLIIQAEGGGSAQFGQEFCKFNSSAEKDGVTPFKSTSRVFYTDPYFTTILDKGGLHAVRQFIKPGFDTLKIAKGEYLPVSPWGGFYKPGHDDSKSKLTNIENAVNPEEN